MDIIEIQSEMRKLFSELSELQRMRKSEGSGWTDEQIDEQIDCVRQVIVDTAAWLIECEVSV